MPNRLTLRDQSLVSLGLAYSKQGEHDRGWVPIALSKDFDLKILTKNRAANCPVILINLVCLQGS